jgi:hypothetical protein
VEKEMSVHIKKEGESVTRSYNSSPPPLEPLSDTMI